MKKKIRAKRIVALFLSISVVLSSGFMAFADTTEEADVDIEVEVQAQEDGESADVTDPAVVDEDGDEAPLPEEDALSEDEIDEDEANDDVVVEEMAEPEIVREDLSYAKTVVVDGDTDVPSMGLVASGSGLYRYTFTGTEKGSYEKLESIISDIANGRRSSTEFEISYEDLGIEGATWTAEELGIDYVYDPKTGTNPEVSNAAYNVIVGNFTAVLTKLLAEHPFELYWYDKTVGAVTGYNNAGIVKENGEYLLTATGGSVMYKFTVASAYSAGDYNVSATKVSAALQAKSNAQAIVNKYKDYSDIEKLTKYKEEICSLVSYNYDAVNGNVKYGDPWQLVYVFDKDSSTNVVCEGYSKAFKYLCDLSDFSSDEITCILATGVFSSSGTNGRHMWNVVSLGNGLNYLVDVTNCDSGTIGADSLLFMKNVTTRVSLKENKFSCKGSTLTYSYDDDICSLFSDDALTISKNVLIGTPVVTASTVHSNSVCGVKLSWSAVSGTSSYKVYRRTSNSSWVLIGSTASTTYTDATAVAGNKYFYGIRCADSSGNLMNVLDSGTGIQFNVSHTAVVDAAVAPDCTHTGLTEGSHCSVCGKVIKAQEVVPAKGHTAVKDPAVEPDCTHTGLTEGSHCSVCSEILTAQQEIPAKGHTAEILPAVEPDCTHSGLTEGSRCSVCGKTLTAQQVIPEKGHTIVKDPAVEPDTEHTGLTEGSHCSVCGEIIKPQQVLPIVAPRVQIAQTDDGILLTWNVIDGAAKYRIYRKALGESKWTSIKTGNVLTYTDKTVVDGVEYHYYVIAMDAAGNRMGSGIKNEVFLKYVAPVSLTPVAELSQEGGILLTWNSIEGAAKYRVYRKAEGDTKWASVKTTTALTFTDKSVNDGVNYSYYVAALDASSQSINVGARKEVTIKYEAPASLSPVVELSLADNGILVKWNAVDGAAKYKVFRKAQGETKWTSVKTTTALSFTDTTVLAGVEYTYGIVGIDAAGTRMGNVDKTATLVFTQIEQTPSIELSLKNNGILVSWKAIDGAAKYRVYRKAAGETKWTSLKTLNALSFTDTTVQNGIEYTYGVVGIDAAGTRMGSVDKTATLVFTQSEAEPVIVLENNANGIKISWKTIDGAAKYRVYRKAAGETKWTSLKTVNGLTYTDTTVESGVEYTYGIVGIDASGTRMGSVTDTAAIVYSAAA